MMRPQFRLALAALVVATLAVGRLGTDAAPAPLTLEDLRTAVALSDPQISPDGTRVVLVVRRGDFVRNQNDNVLELVDSRTGSHRTLVRERHDVTSPRWSPSGDRLAYIATPAAQPDEKVKPKPQLFVLRFDGGEPEQITHAKNGVGAFSWRPDGRAFAYLTKDDSPDQKRIDAHDDWFEVTDDAWTARAAAVPSHLHTIALDGSGEKRITHGIWSLEAPLAYAPDGRTIYCGRSPRALTNHYRRRQIVAIDLASGRLDEITKGARGAGEATVSPDGTALVYTAERADAFSQNDAYAVTMAGRHERDLTTRLDRNVDTPTFRGRSLVVAANDVAQRRLFEIDANGIQHALPLGGIDVLDGATSSHDGTLAFVGSAAHAPAELYVLPRAGNVPKRLTAFNARLGAHAFGAVRTIRWHGPNGFEPSGILTEPARMQRGKRYPLVLVIHGGPTATSTNEFDDFAQILAGRGWLVFEPNYRGSDNLGHAFAQATVPGITSSPGQDILDGLAAVLKLGIVDTSRIGVSGWSEGGLLTSWLIGHDTRWRAAVSGAAVNDWTGYADLTDAQDFSPSFLGGSPWASDAMRARYAAESPLTYASAVKTPTLILTDAGDYRVPTPLSYEFYHAIRATGTPVSLVIVPVDGHFPRDPLHREDVFRRWIDWFAVHFAAP